MQPIKIKATLHKSSTDTTLLPYPTEELPQLPEVKINKGRDAEYRKEK
jgi:hypothetical protein